MLRAFYSGKLERGVQICLEEDEAHHLFHVLRAKSGESVMILNGQGSYAHAHVIDSKSQKIIVDDLAHATLSNITLCPALLKSKAMDFLIREATAIGIAKIIPLCTQNSEVKIQNIADKQVHWNRVVREACKQSGNPYLPIIEIPRKLKDLQFSIPTFVAALHKNSKNIFQYQSEIKNNPIAILIGPEGDFSEEEYYDLGQKNFHFIHLGKHILRAETAALYLLSVIDHIIRN